MPKLSIIKVSTIAVFIFCTLMSSVFIFLQYQSRLEFATTQALTNHQQALKEVLTRIRSDYSNAQKVLSSLIYRYQAKQTLLDEFPPLLLKELSMFLHKDIHVDAIMFATQNGELWALHQLTEEQTALFANAPINTYFIVQNLNAAQEVRIYYTQSLELLDQEKLAASIDYTKRPWYTQAQKSNALALVEPYQDQYSNKKIFSLVKQQNQLTVSVDLNSTSLYASMYHDKLKFNTWLFLMNSSNKILALQDSKSIQLEEHQIAPWQTWLAQSATLVRSTNLTKLTEVTANDDKWYMSATHIEPQTKQGVMLVAATKAEYILQPIYNQLYVWLLVVLSVSLILIPISYLLARLMTRPIRQLENYASQLANFETPKPFSNYIKVEEIEDLKISLKHLYGNLNEFFSLLATLSKENDLQRLIDKIASQSANMMVAQGCLILLTQNNKLCAELLCFDGQKYDTNTLAQINWQKLYQLDEVSKTSALPNELKTLLSQSDNALYQLLVPLKNREQQVIGLQIYLYPNSTEKQTISLKLAEQVATFFGVAIEGRKLVNKQEKLLDSFIHVIAGAIDTKSHYTGKHCQRVPELATALATHAGNSQLFPQFAFNDGAKRQLSIAAWLHDCGKVTTPEYIVDKATRLETIYNRIHEIRTRFEVVKRDLEIAALKQQLASVDKDQIEAQLQQQINQLEQDFAHVAYCNTAEFVSDSDITKLEKISQRMWRPYFDERLGLSQEELTRYDSTQLTQDIGLLVNKTSHLLADQNLNCDKQKYTLVQPALRNNLGELYNLSIRSGTINNEERYAINHHIVQTIEILEKLPFPKHLNRVPEIAGAHHEKLNGQGYPKGLSGDAISFEARILAIADIFEALTSSDRPYKQAKTLTQALEIMQKLAAKEELDQTLLNFFISEKIPEKYAEQYLKPEQMN
ncbi:Cyclic di-GMP phosphodiesterase response regulator RpfG [Pseudoalteromonas sp. P1-9]|nr:Cyclic di-GMP phosphodiesterase response regulator RpfG [Pseudoalteromonas sp. P1-9]